MRTSSLINALFFTARGSKRKAWVATIHLPAAQQTDYNPTLIYVTQSGLNYPKLKFHDHLVDQVNELPVPCEATYKVSSPTNDLTYMIWQLERCSDTQRLHLQLYVEFNNPLRIKPAQKALHAAGAPDDKMHMEARKGTPAQAAAYCKKADTAIPGCSYEWGTMSGGQGSRTDLKSLRDAIKDGKSFQELVDDDDQLLCLAKHDRFASKLFNMYKKHKNTHSYAKVDVHVLWGKTRTGKTRSARETADSEPFVLTLGDGNWFDGYTGEKVLIIDEFRDSQVPIGELLRLLDHYQCRLKVKGDFTYSAWDTVYITSNVNPLDWYKGCILASREALCARFTEITEFTDQAGHCPKYTPNPAPDLTGGTYAGFGPQHP